KGFHRIRHYGLLATGARAANIAHARELLAVPSRPKEPETPEAAIDEPRVLPRPCPGGGARMIVIETFERGCEPTHRRCLTSRDFVPWRFSDAGRRCAGIASSSRRPKTCTRAAVGNAAYSQ